MDSGNKHPAQKLNDMIERLINDKKIERKEDLMLRTDDPEKLANKFLDNAKRFRLKPGGDLLAYRKHIADLNDHFAMIQNTGGGKNDCLIISFLMGVSPAYLSAGEPGRNSIASFFRRTILPYMLRESRDPNVLATLGGNTDALIGELTSTSYLSDIHITLLGHLFQVSILTLETGKAGRMGTIDMLEPPTLALLPAINKGFKKQYDRGIIICNRGNGHYETVMNTDAKKVLFLISDLVNLFDFVREGIPFLSDRVDEGEHRDRLGGIEIDTKDFVKHDNQLFVVIERKVNGVETWEEKNLGRITRNKIGQAKGPVTLRGAWITPILNPPPKGWDEAFLVDSNGTSTLQYKVGTEYTERRGYQKLEEPDEPRRVKAVIFIGARAIEKIPESEIPNILDADMADREGQGVDTSIPGFVYLKPTLSKRRNIDMEIYRSALNGPAEAPGEEWAEGRGGVAAALARRAALGSPPAAPAQWECPICSLKNPMSARECEACGGPRPAGSNVANAVAGLRLVPPPPPLRATRRRLANALKAGRDINEDSPEAAAERARQLREGKLPANVKRYIEFTRKIRKDRRGMNPEERRKLWRCEQCLLDNPITKSQCEACNTVRSVLPPPLPSPWRHENVDKLLDDEERAPERQLPPGALRVALAREKLALPPVARPTPPVARPTPPAPEAQPSRLDELQERVKKLQARVAKLSPIKQKEWDCRICTLKNPGSANKCAACQFERGKGGSRRKRKTSRRKKRNIVGKSSNVRSFKRK